MPVVLRFGRFSFVIYPQDHTPAHVHVKAADAEARFEIETGKCLAVYGFKQNSINQLAEIIEQNKDLLMEQWNEYQGK